MSQPVPSASRAVSAWETVRDSGVGPQPGAEARAILSQRLRLLAPLLLSVCVFFFFRNLGSPGDLPASRFGLLVQLVLLALMTAGAAPLYGSSRLSLRGLRTLELILFGLAATYLAWLQCYTLFEAWDLREASPAHGPVVLRMALGAAAGRWLLLIVAYGVFVPNTPRRCALVLGPLMLMPLIIAAGAGLGNPAARGSFWLAAVQMAASLVGAGAAALFACARCNGLPPAPALENDLIGQYFLKGPLRAGGMGEVFLAEHVLLKRPCALKLVRAEAARDPAVRRRFEREARAMAALRHPNAVTVHDCGRAPDGTLYYVMEYLPGVTLEGLVGREGPLAPARVVALLRQLCAALAEAHGHGILHLDIKPGNVVVVAGPAGETAKLLDFGLAREVGPEGLGMQSSGAEGAGSPQYMSPEQAAGRGPLDARADLYGLGGLAYFLLTGRPPFDCESALQLVLAHACDPVTPPARLRPEVPADLEAVVLRCLEKDPAGRFAAAAQLAAALAACACASPDAATAPTPRSTPEAPTLFHGS